MITQWSLRGKQTAHFPFLMRLLVIYHYWIFMPLLVEVKLFTAYMDILFLDNPIRR